MGGLGIVGWLWVLRDREGQVVFCRFVNIGFDGG